EMVEITKQTPRYNDLNGISPLVFIPEFLIRMDYARDKAALKKQFAEPAPYPQARRSLILKTFERHLKYLQSIGTVTSEMADRDYGVRVAADAGVPEPPRSMIDEMIAVVKAARGSTDYHHLQASQFIPAVRARGGQVSDAPAIRTERGPEES